MDKDKKKRNKKKKPNRLHKWLIKNSIIYRSGRKILKSKTGKACVSLIAFLLIIFLSFHFINVYNVKNKVKILEETLREGNIGNISEWVDFSSENPYKETLPDFDSLIEQKIFFDISIKNMNFSRHYKWAEIDVKVDSFEKKEKLDSFEGRILLQKNTSHLFSWKIVGLESY
ncbi:MAG: hypothetical protein ACOC5F_04710 [Candidatus Aminicenantaceae bacterium]